MVKYVRENVKDWYLFVVRGNVRVWNYIICLDDVEEGVEIF